MISGANRDKIEFRAEIDDEKNLDMIQLIHGDKRRYLQIFLNFLSNSLKFTNPEGRVTVALKILNQQACGDKQHEQGLKHALEKSQNKIIDKFSR